VCVCVCVCVCKYTYTYLYIHKYICITIRPLFHMSAPRRCDQGLLFSQGKLIPVSSYFPLLRLYTCYFIFVLLGDEFGGFRFLKESSAKNAMAADVRGLTAPPLWGIYVCTLKMYVCAYSGYQNVCGCARLYFSHGYLTYMYVYIHVCIWIYV